MKKYNSPLFETIAVVDDILLESAVNAKNSTWNDDPWGNGSEGGEKLW